MFFQKKLMVDTKNVLFTWVFIFKTKYWIFFQNSVQNSTLQYIATNKNPTNNSIFLLTELHSVLEIKNLQFFQKWVFQDANSKMHMLSFKSCFFKSCFKMQSHFKKIKFYTRTWNGGIPIFQLGVHVSFSVNLVCVWGSGPPNPHTRPTLGFLSIETHAKNWKCFFTMISFIVLL